MRKQIVTLALSSAVLIAGLVLSVPAEAAFDPRTTHMTFANPIRVPGATLPAGHYVFTVDPGKHGSHLVVWIRNEDDNHVYGAYLTQPRWRVRPTSELQILVERSEDANGIPSLRGWFGRNRVRGYTLAW